jgi:hypothetical protein
MVDRGCADVALFSLLTEWGVACVLRVKQNAKVQINGAWHTRNTLRFSGNTRRRILGCLPYWARCPQLLWVTMSRKWEATGKWGLWSLVANRPYAAAQTVAEYVCRPGCEASFRDAK